VFLPFRALLDPSCQQRDLSLSELLTRCRAALTSWHPDSRIRGRDPARQFTVGRIARDDRKPAATQCVLGSIFQVEPERSLLCGRSMTLEAFVGEYGADVSVELDGCRKRFPGREGRGRLPRCCLQKDRTEQREHTDP
jgi:hypothetical protein